MATLRLGSWRQRARQACVMPSGPSLPRTVADDHERWRWDLNPRTGYPVTRFRVLRTHVQERSSASTPCSTSPAATFPEPSRTTANETKTETTSDAASSRPRVLTSDSYGHVGGTPFLRMRTAHCPGASGSRL